VDFEQEHREALKHTYGFADWGGREGAVPGRVRFVPDAERLPDLAFEERTALPVTGHSFIDHYRVGEEGGRVALTVVEYGTPSDAQEGLLDVLSRSMAVQLPSCSERGLAVGDACFCGFGEPITAVFFARRNVLVRVESVGTAPVSVADVARGIDAQLQEGG
jgi:hypothetical protein